MMQMERLNLHSLGNPLIFCRERNIFDINHGVDGCEGQVFLDHPEGAGLQRADRVDFDPRVRLEFRGTQLSSDGSLLVIREMDDALGLSNLASAALCYTQRGKNTVHRLDGLFRRSVYGRLTIY
jgi:hypothetical protein